MTKKQKADKQKANKEKAVQLLSIALLFVLLILFSFFFYRIKKETAALYVYTQEDEAQSNIRWWCKSENEYYLFLPSYAKEKTWYLGLEDMDSIWLDGVEMEAGTKLPSLQEGTYTVITEGQKEIRLTVMHSANVPAVFIQTDSGTLSYVHEAKENIDSGEMHIVRADGKVDYTGKLDRIKGRGNWTWIAEKKPYQLRLDKPADLLNMGEAENWVLLANYYDQSLIRNKITYNMAAHIGLSYTPDNEFIDLYVDGEYLGSYQLCDKIEIGENRIAIHDLEKETKKVNRDISLSEYPAFGQEESNSGTIKGYEIGVNPKDISGGYILEAEVLAERYAECTSGFVTDNGQKMALKTPDKASREQVEYVSTLTQLFEDALLAEDGKNIETGKYFYEYMDLDSFVKKYLLEEVSKNVDAVYSSQFFYKPQDSMSTLLYAGPGWDYDRTFGNFNGRDGYSMMHATGLYANNDATSFLWYEKAYEQAAFYDKIVTTYREDFLPYLERLVEKDIDAYADYLEASANMNFVRFDILDKESEPGCQTGTTYEENIAYLKAFVKARTEYLNAIWLKEKQSVAVSLDMNGGYFYYDHIDVLSGETFEIKSMPYKYDEAGEDILFHQWIDAETGELYDFSKPVTKNITLVAKWEE